MISTNALSVIILHHHLNGIDNKNIRSIQEIMRASDPAAKKYKKVCEYFLNLAILIKIATPGEVQITFVHATAGNNSLGGSVVAFALARDLSSPSVFFRQDGHLFCRGQQQDPSPDRGRSPLYRFRRPCALEEAVVLDAAQRRSPPAIPRGGRNPPQGVGRGRASEDFRSLHHGVGEGRGHRQRVRLRR